MHGKILITIPAVTVAHFCTPGPWQLLLTSLASPSLLPQCPSQGHTEPFGQEDSAKRKSWWRRRRQWKNRGPSNLPPSLCFCVTKRILEAVEEEEEAEEVKEAEEVEKNRSLQSLSLCFLCVCACERRRTFECNVMPFGL